MAHVLIAGAGPAGAALAYLLARRGLRVTLVERQTDFEREFRGEVLMPSGIDAIAQMGLTAAFEALPQARPLHLDAYLDGRFVQRLELSALVGEGPRMVSQPAMLEMLVEHCSAFEGFRFVRGETVSDLLMDGPRTRGVRLRGAARPELPGDLVVGADGRGSIVRKRAGLEADCDAEAFDVVWFKVPLPPWMTEEGDAVQVHIRPGHLCLAFPTYDDKLQVGWVIGKGEYGDLKRRGTDAWLEDLAQQVGSELGRHLVRHRDALEHPFVLDVVCYLLEHWTAPGVLLLGDAAHPMSPVGGQGLNIALRDALVAANHLVPVLEAGGEPAALDAAARAVRDERYPEAREIQRLQRLPPRFLFGRAPWVGPLLRVAAWLLRRARVAERVRPPAIAQSFLYGTRAVDLRV